MKSKATLLLIFVLFSCTTLHKLHGQILDSQIVMLRIDSLHDVSLQLAGAGNIDKALALNAEVEKMVLERFGQESAVYGECCIVKGLIYRYNGEYNKSIQMHFEALDIFEKTVGKDHTSFAKTLNNLGGLYKSIGKYEKAVGYYIECKDIYQKALGREHPKYATALGNIGRLYDSMSQYGKAEGYYLECMEIYEKTHGKEHHNYTTSLFDLIRIYESQAEYEKAVGYLLEYKEALEKTIGNEHPYYTTILHNLGSLYESLGQFDKAERYYLKSKEILEKSDGTEHINYATTLNNLGALYESMGQYEKAEGYHLECKQIKEKILGKEHPDYAITLNNLGDLNESIGKYKKAEGYYLECKGIQEKTIGNDHPDYAITLNNLGSLCKSMGQYEKAEEYYLECKEIQANTIGKEHPDYAITLGNLGGVYQVMGQYLKAEKSHLECKEIQEKTIGKEHPHYSTTIYNLAVLYECTGQKVKAEMFFLECKIITEKILGKDHPKYATNLCGLGIFYQSIGHYQKAEAYFLESKDIREKSLGKEHLDYSRTLDNLGILYHYTDQQEKAEENFLESKEISEKSVGKAHPEYITTLYNLGFVYQTMGEYEKAELLIDTAMRAIQQSLRQSVQFLSEKDLGDYLKKENGVLKYLPSILGTGKFSTRMAGLAYDDALFQKGFLQTAARRLSTLTAANPEADSLSQLLASYRKRLSTEYTKPIAKRSAEVAAMENRANELESQMARVVAGYSEALQQVKWQEVQAALKPNEAAIEFLQFRKMIPNKTDTIRYAALLLRPGMEAPMYINLCDERAIDSLMIRNIDRQVAYVSRLYAGSDFNRSTTDTSLQMNRAIKKSTTNLGLEPSEGAESFRSLYELLWQPLEKHLNGVEVVYYANAGLMHRINLGAITTGKDNVLADRYKLVELGSTRSLVVPEKTPEGNSNALVMGGIKYDSDSTALKTALFALDTISYALRGGVRFYRNATDTTFAEYWEQLPFTSKEADGIGLLLQKSRIPSLVLKDYQATEEAFYKSVRLQGTSPRIIHLATHGYFLPDPKSTDKESAGSTFRLSENPLIRSGLILAGGNQAWMTGQSASLGQEDGILTAYEISRLNLTGTELVVLSACETGLGDIQGNEGVYGLQRAFKIAGVRYVIMSLWQIPDEQSSLFMEHFYQRWLEQGMSIPEAFRQTQTAMRQNKWSHHQWAGFVLLE